MKVLGNKFSSKEIGNFRAFVKTVKTDVGIIWATFGNIWALFFAPTSAVNVIKLF